MKRAGQNSRSLAKNLVMAFKKVAMAFKKVAVAFEKVAVAFDNVTAAFEARRPGSPRVRPAQLSIAAPFRSLRVVSVGHGAASFQKPTAANS